MGVQIRFKCQLAPPPFSLAQPLATSHLAMTSSCPKLPSHWQPIAGTYVIILVWPPWASAHSYTGLANSEGATNILYKEVHTAQMWHSQVDIRDQAIIRDFTLASVILVCHDFRVHPRKSEVSICGSPAPCFMNDISPCFLGGSQ